MIALRSLRARIFLLTLVIGLVPCIAMRHGIVSNYEDLAVATQSDPYLKVGIRMELLRVVLGEEGEA